MLDSYKLFKMRVNRILSLYLVSPLQLFLYRRKYDYVADVEKSLWIKISSIEYWYRGNRFGEITFPGEIRGGDWESKITPRENFIQNSNPKYYAMVQRYTKGMSWMETDLFQSYEKKITEGKKVKGYDDISEVEKYYNRVYDRIYQSIQENGVLPANENNPHIAPIYIIIYSNGEILYTVDGNHRLYMCLAAGIDKIPVRVWMRHKQWQEKREHILSRKGRNVDEKYRKFLDHPDITSEL